MKSAIAFGLVIVTSMPALAQTQSTPLRDAANREAIQLARTIGTVQPPRSAPGGGRSWAARHPALLGALVGLGAGFTIGAARCRYPGGEGSSCSDYTFPGNARLLGGLTIGGLGAGIGAGVGAVIRAARQPPVEWSLGSRIGAGFREARLLTCGQSDNCRKRASRRGRHR